MARRSVRIGAGLLACALVVMALAGSRLTLLVLDVPDRRATLLLPRSAPYGMGLLETETSLCARQGPGSPLHSLHLPPQFCPMALATGIAAPGRALVELPYLGVLRPWVER